MASKLLDRLPIQEVCGNDELDLGSIVLHSDSSISDSVTKAKSEDEREVSIDLDATGDKHCTVCIKQKNKKSIAICVCVSCGHLFLCEECALVHDKKIKIHSVDPLNPEKMAEICDKHTLPLETYCSTCQKTLCAHCVMLEQHEHAVDCLADVIKTRVTAMKVLIKKKEQEIDERTKENEKLLDLDGYTRMKERRDELKRQVKHQGERNIEAIGRMEKEALREIDEKFKVVSDISEYTRIFNKSSFRDAEKHLVVPGQNCKYVEELNSLEKEISDISVPDAADAGICSVRLQEVIKMDYRFIPKEVQSFGRIVPDEFHPKEEDAYEEEKIAKVEDEVCTHAVVIDDKYYAVYFYESKCFFIYEFPFIKQHSFKGVVGGMSATPDGELLVLLAPRDKPHYIINTYNPKSGDVVSTVNVDISKPPCGICETPRHQYIILHGPTEKRQLSVFERSGELKVTYEFSGEDQLSGPRRVSCGGQLLFVVAGRSIFGIYMIHEGNIKRVKTLECKYNSLRIAAIAEDVFFLCGKKGSEYYLIRYRQKDGNHLEWEEKAVRVRHDGKMVPVIATSDGRTIVVTDDSIIRLYKA